MRTAVVEEIVKIMDVDPNVYFLVGDLGYNFCEPIEEKFPERFINVGIAEQNMIGIASGLAMTGKKVYVYSIITFLVMRCFEQIRNDICYHNLDVTLLGSGAGLTYGVLSSTHFALEDMAILKTLPNMTVFSPADEMEIRLGIKKSANHKGPLYVRIGARVEPRIYEKPFDFDFGKGVVLKKGKDITVFVNGTLIEETLKATEMFEKETGMTATIVDIHTIKPIDTTLIRNESQGKKAIFTIEEHYESGGLGSAVIETISDIKNRPPVTRIGVENLFITKGGNRAYLRQKMGLDASGLKQRFMKALS